MATRMEPKDIVRSTELTLEEKAKLLRDWDNELRELMVADDESMGGVSIPRITLAEVAEAMHRLGLTHRPAPTKHG